LTELPPKLLANLHRFACLLRGDADAALDDLGAVIGKAQTELDQLRNEKAAVALLVRRLRAQAAKATASGGGGAGDDTALFLRRFGGIAGPERDALALFYTGLLSLDETASVLGVELDELATQLGRARAALRGRAFAFQNPLLNCHRPWDRAGNSRVAKAVKQARADDSQKALLDGQAAFDGEQMAVIEAINQPEEIAARFEQGEAPGRKAAMRDPIVLAGICGVLLILGLVVFFGMQRMKRFPGQDAVFDMVDTAEKMSGTEVEPVEMQIGSLGDWLFMKFALENYQPSPDLAAVKTAGCRVFKPKGHPVAQIIVGKPQAVLYVFKSADFGVNIQPQDEWRFFEREEWAGAASAHGEFCTVISVRGGEKEARKAVAKLTGRAAR
jgi:hypothetical protein